MCDDRCVVEAMVGMHFGAATSGVATVTEAPLDIESVEPAKHTGWCHATTRVNVM